MVRSLAAWRASQRPPNGVRVVVCVWSGCVHGCSLCGGDAPQTTHLADCGTSGGQEDSERHISADREANAHWVAYVCCASVRWAPPLTTGTGADHSLVTIAWRVVCDSHFKASHCELCPWDPLTVTTTTAIAINTCPPLTTSLNSVECVTQSAVNVWDQRLWA
ncbi:unnamed protein product [Oppiella nova]|uniref:Uncharacterized protein n=1 Tax=Oppiella nova TaxID=334625 RepID=A0A7R9LE16_9ACAR|nr:unnamed protein product [Oppiella nova]CAG2162157.1 unnamed protein product [Oppiella nova]